MTTASQLVLFWDEDNFKPTEFREHYSRGTFARYEKLLASAKRILAQQENISHHNLQRGAARTVLAFHRLVKYTEKGGSQKLQALIKEFCTTASHLEWSARYSSPHMKDTAILIQAEATRNPYTMMQHFPVAKRMGVAMLYDFFLSISKMLKSSVAYTMLEEIAASYGVVFPNQKS